MAKKKQEKKKVRSLKWYMKQKYRIVVEPFPEEDGGKDYTRLIFRPLDALPALLSAERRRKP